MTTTLSATALSAAASRQYLNDYREHAVKAPAPPWLRSLRDRGIASFSEQGFPTARRGNELWKYTNVAPIAEASFAHAAEGPSPTAASIAPFILGRGWPRLTFINGRFSHKLSSGRGLSPGMTVENLASVSDNPLASRHLAGLVAPETGGFAALNTAFLGDGAFVHLAEGSVMQRPLHLLFLSTAARTPAVSHPRILLLAGAGSSASLVETYAPLENDKPYFTNAVLEMYLDEGAALDHYKILLESQKAFHIAETQVHQSKESKFTSMSISAGGALARNTFTVVLDGEGAHCSLNGLHITTGTQHLDNTLFIDHAKPHTTSDEFYKGILDGNSRAVFGGRVLVRKDAQKVEAHQQDKNLVLSHGAEIDSKPQLEIYANDVKCTHGATAAQLSGNDLFYLEARGIDKARARELLAQGFAQEVLDRIGPPQVKKQAEELLRRRLPGDAGD